MKPKAKIKFCRFENALAMQVLYMDERFRATIGERKMFQGYGLSAVISCSKAGDPHIDDHISHIYLRGAFSNRDHHVSVSRCAYVETVVSLLKDWAQNWEGWKGEPAIEPKITDDFGNEIDLETYTGSVVVVEV